MIRLNWFAQYLRVLTVWENLKRHRADCSTNMSPLHGFTLKQHFPHEWFSITNRPHYVEQWQIIFLKCIYYNKCLLWISIFHNLFNKTTPPPKKKRFYTIHWRSESALNESVTKIHPKVSLRGHGGKKIWDGSKNHISKAVHSPEQFCVPSQKHWKIFFLRPYHMNFRTSLCWTTTNILWHTPPRKI